MSSTLPDQDTESMIYGSDEPLDPLGEVEKEQPKNRAKVGSARPSALLYTFGVGSIMDLPHFSIMPAGLDDWEPIWKRRANSHTIDEPRLLKAVRDHLGYGVTSLRPFPWQPKTRSYSQEGSDLGIPARVFPQWLRCTGCDLLAPLTRFTYTNTHPYRTDQARFEHAGCPGRQHGRTPTPRGAKKTDRRAPAVPARYLLACPDGHLDEFCYDLWVHHGRPCTKARVPDLKLRDTNIGQGASAVISCTACEKTRGMGEAQGETGRRKLPTCRGRHPHLDAFDHECGNPTTLIMMGASNLWFSSTQSVIVMPRTQAERSDSLAMTLLTKLGAEDLASYAHDPKTLRLMLRLAGCDLDGVSDEDLLAAVATALAPPGSEEERHRRQQDWDPNDLRVPEWDYLQRPSLFAQQDDASGLSVTEQPRGRWLPTQIHRVIAVNRMKKVNAVLGFTRIDEMDRVGDVATRLVKLTRNGHPRWVPATEDRGEGIFLQLNEDAVATWETRIEATRVWEAHRASHKRNFIRRFSATAAQVEPDTRFPPPRFWLVHTLAHILIREMAMSCGYGAASLSERLYAWPETPGRQGAAGLLICTTASDSEGTLGGLVALSDPERLQSLVADALRRAARCSSDPVCAQRTPHDPEDFLHGAACHCCCFASETSCEKANRFLDRRFLLDLPTTDDQAVPGFFGTIDDL